jgi:hypothetical protein
MPTMDNATLIALGTFLVTIGSTVVGITLGIKRISDNVKVALDAQIETNRRDIAEVQLSGERRVGELGHALREKITQVEFHLRDNYVSQPTFYRFMDMTAADIDNQFRTMQEMMSRLNDKIDQLIAARL